MGIKMINGKFSVQLTNRGFGRVAPKKVFFSGMHSYVVRIKKVECSLIQSESETNALLCSPNHFLECTLIQSVSILGVHSYVVPFNFRSALSFKLRPNNLYHSGQEFDFLGRMTSWLKMTSALDIHTIKTKIIRIIYEKIENCRFMGIYYAFFQ